MGATAEWGDEQDRCYCPDCRKDVDADETQCVECGAMFPAMGDRQGSYPLAFARMIVVPITVTAIFMAVCLCVSVLFSGGHLFEALFLAVIAVGLGHVARRLYTQSGSFWAEIEEGDANRPRWQRRALEHLPDRRATVLRAESHVDLWQLLKEDVAEGGHDPLGRTEIADMFRYAWWCVTESGDPDLRVEVETFFYEDLPVYSDLEEQLPAYLTPSQFEYLERVFAARLTEEEFESFRLRYSDSIGRDTD